MRLFDPRTRLLSLPLICLLFLNACKRESIKPQPDARLLVGTWLSDQSYQSGYYKITTVVAPDGTWVASIVSECKLCPDGVKIYDLAGTLELKDGILVDTITKHSQTNAPLPIKSYGEIIKLDESILIVRDKATKKLTTFTKSK